MPLQNTLNWDRSQNLENLSKSPHTQLLIVGGGIHGACLARIAALNGTTCTLIERGDYASGTSSRSSKMAHGGLRYLENFDFKQVFEGIKAREEMFEDASHICKPDRFLIPVDKGNWWFRVKLGIGLYLYDLMVTKKERKHSWISRAKLAYEGFTSKRTDLMGCYAYTDGIMNDSRMVIENVVQARELGARALNYIAVVKVEKNSAGKFEVLCKDQFTGAEYPLTADLVINCAGPWAPYIGHKQSEGLASQLKYSAGIHLIFNKPWNSPSLFLPMPGQNRYYFVWPHPGGTMIGTTEREVTDIPFEQYPIEAEIGEVLERIKRDLPDSGLSRETLHYSFAGVRTLPLRDGEQSTAKLSRKHIWKDQDGVLSLLGGKFTTSSWTSFEGYKIAAQMLGLNQKPKSLSGLKYPGYGSESEITTITKKLIEAGIPSDTVNRIVRRLGSRAAFLLEEKSRLELISPRLLKGELELGIKFEQAMTIEDLLRRRTELEYMNGSGLEELDAVANYLSNLRDKAEVSKEAHSYQERIKKIFTLLGRSSTERSLASAA